MPDLDILAATLVTEALIFSFGQFRSSLRRPSRRFRLLQSLGV